MRKINLCRKCQSKLHFFVPYKPDIGDQIIIINNHSYHDIPIGTIMEVKHLYYGMDGTLVLDKEVSPKIIPEVGNDIVIMNSDYVVINTEVI